MKTIFPEEMLNSSQEAMTLESIAAKFDYFFSQFHLLHLRTSSYAEHMALNLWQDMPDDKDEFLEKLSGYTGRKLRSYKFLPIVDNVIASNVVQDLKSFAKDLKSYADSNGYQDIANLADTLSGKASKTLFLLTLS